MLSVKFDGTTISPNAVYKLAYRGKLFTDSIKLGATLCKEFTLDVDKSVVSTQPSVITIESDEGGGVVLATLHIDSLDDTNDYYYSYTLLDSMVLLNQEYSWGDGSITVQNIVEGICNKYGITPPTANYYARDMVVSWSDYSSCRDLISYVAELQGGYAYIDGDNQLVFQPFNNTSVATYTADMLADQKVGNYHAISKVVYDNLSHYESGTDTGDTLYLNPDNILFNDGDVYNIQDMVTHIGGIINGFAFYNMKVSQMSIASEQVPVGRIITVNGLPTILEVDWEYNSGWIGGLDLELNTPTQQETKVVDSQLERAINRIDVTLDRQNGIIDLMGERVDTLEEENIHFQVDAAKSEARVTNQNTYTPTSYTSFKGDGMRIYVDNVNVAEATAQRFNCNEGLGVQDWVIEHGEDPSVLLFYRRA